MTDVSMHDVSTSGITILGAGGSGSEVWQYAREVWPDGRVRGLLDDRPEDALPPRLRPHVLGPLRDSPLLQGPCVIAVGDPTERSRLAALVRAAGGLLVSVLHPRAYIAETSEIGPGTVVAPFATVAPGAVVGANSLINLYASVCHDAQIGPDSVLSPYATTLGNSHAGARTLIGTHATVKPGVRIGRDSRIDAGAVVSRDCEPGSLVAGNPGRARVMYDVAE